MGIMRCTAFMSRLRIEKGRKMNCEINPAMFKDIQTALESVGIMSYCAGALTGLLLAAPLAWVVSELWAMYRQRGTM